MMNDEAPWQMRECRIRCSRIRDSSDASAIANSQRALRVFYRRFARYFHQCAKQTLRERIRFGHSLRMPLDASDPVRVARPFDGLDHSVWSPGDNSQVASWIEDRLVVGAIDAHFVRACQFPEARTGFNFCGMEGFRSAFIAV